jgi:hypothetical protein
MTTRKEPQKSTLEHFCEFLRSNFADLEHSGGGGANLRFPEFELMPQDYLDFAEEALLIPTQANRINCITHLKRAIECQCETMLHVLNLQSKGKNANFPRKLEWVSCLSLMPSRSLAELNRIRNKVEHDYAHADDTDLSVFFDLVAGFVASVEGALFMIASSIDTEWRENLDDISKRYGSFGYDFDSRSVKFQYSDGYSHFVHEQSDDDLDSLLMCLGILFSIIRSQALVTPEYVISRLPK